MTEQFEVRTFKLPVSCTEIIDDWSINLNIPREKAVALLIALGAEKTKEKVVLKEVVSEALEPTIERLKTIEGLLGELIQIGDTLPCWSENQIDNHRLFFCAYAWYGISTLRNGGFVVFYRLHRFA